MYDTTLGVHIGMMHPYYSPSYLGVLNENTCLGVGASNLCLFSHFTFTLHKKFAWRLIRYVFLGAGKWHVSGGGGRFGRSLYGILFDSTWTTADSKDGAVRVGGFYEYVVCNK